MVNEPIIIKGNKYGLNIIIDFNNFKDFENMIEGLNDKLSKGRKFYRGAVIKITTQLKYLNERQQREIKDILFEKFLIRDCIFENKQEKTVKVFSGIYEGRTKFLRNSIRSGQCINYSGNVVIIGDVSPGAEVHAGGNIIVLGNLRGDVFAGLGGNTKAIIAAYMLQPQILKIADIVTRSPEDTTLPQYPEVAKIKDKTIIVEPYLPNKYY